MLPRNSRPIRLSDRLEPFDSEEFIFELKVRVTLRFTRANVLSLANHYTAAADHGARIRAIGGSHLVVVGDSSGAADLDPEFVQPTTTRLLAVDSCQHKVERPRLILDNTGALVLRASARNH